MSNFRNKLGLSWAKLSLIRIGDLPSQWKPVNIWVKTCFIKLYQFKEHLSKWRFFSTLIMIITLMETDRNCPFNEITLMKTHNVAIIPHFDEKADENASLWLKFITMMKIIDMIRKYHFDKIFITLVRIHHFDENSSLWCQFITLMQIYHFDANLSLWWKFINLMKSHHFNDKSSLW